MLIQLAISRSREYAADESAGRLTGRPLNLAQALLRLEQGVQLAPVGANPATAHMYIVNPLRGGGLVSLFSTHPSTADRVARLEALDRALHASSR
jgi:heat shock protein HtpX